MAALSVQNATSGYRSAIPLASSPAKSRVRSARLAGYSSSQHYLAHPQGARGPESLAAQHVHDRILECGSQLWHRDVAQLGSHSRVTTGALSPVYSAALLRPFDELQHGSLEAAETEVVGIFEPCSRQAVGVFLAILILTGRPLNSWTSRIAQTQETRYLIERLAGGVVTRLSKQLIPAVLGNEHQLAVRAGNDQCQQRKHRVRQFKRFKRLRRLYGTRPRPRAPRGAANWRRYAPPDDSLQ